jgi:hypothetical protein
MHSLPKYPICRISCRHDALVMYSLPVLAVLAICSIAISGLSMPLKIALMLVAVCYSAVSLQCYKKQAVYVLESNASGVLFFERDGMRHVLESASWRDWGFLIELQVIMQGKQVSKFWFCARLNPAKLRQLRLIIRAQNRKAVNSLPSIITNPVL